MPIATMRWSTSVAAPRSRDPEAMVADHAAMHRYGAGTRRDLSPRTDVVSVFRVRHGGLSPGTKDAIVTEVQRGTGFLNIHRMSVQSYERSNPRILRPWAADSQGANPAGTSCRDSLPSQEGQHECGHCSEVGLSLPQVTMSTYNRRQSKATPWASARTPTRSPSAARDRQGAVDQAEQSGAELEASPFVDKRAMGTAPVGSEPRYRER